MVRTHPGGLVHTSGPDQGNFEEVVAYCSGAAPAGRKEGGHGEGYDVSGERNLVMERLLERLSRVLWREREMLETLQYHLEVEQLILASGRTRWLGRAAKDVEGVLDQMRRTEVMRAVAADDAAAALGLDPNPSLRDLAERAPAPWDEILSDHRSSFMTMTIEITELADANRDLITSGYRSARETLLALGEATEGYAADGSAVVSATAPSRFDRTF
jgi:flagellar FlgN protein